MNEPFITNSLKPSQYAATEGYQRFILLANDFVIACGRDTNKDLQANGRVSALVLSPTTQSFAFIDSKGEIYRGLTKFALSAVRPALSQALRFRNAYGCSPVSLPTELSHSTTSSLPAKGVKRQRPITSIRWPSHAQLHSLIGCSESQQEDRNSSELKHVVQRDPKSESVSIWSLDKLARVTLYPVLRIVRSLYPIPIISTTTTRSGGNTTENSHPFSGKEGGDTLEYVWAEQTHHISRVPEYLEHGYTLAREGLKLFRRAEDCFAGAGSSMLSESQQEEEGSESSSIGSGKQRGTENLEKEEAANSCTYVSVLQPVDVSLEARRKGTTGLEDWDQLGEADLLLSLLLDLCTEEGRDHFPSISDPSQIVVEKCPEARYWVLPERKKSDGSTGSPVIEAVVNGDTAALRLDNGFITLRRRGQKDRVFSENAVPWTIRLDTSGNDSGLLLKRVTRHMICLSRHLQDCQRKSPNKVPTKPSHHRSRLSNNVVDVKETAFGKFTAFADGRARAVFNDRTMVELDSEWKKAEVIDSQGHICELPVASAGAFQEYVNALQSYIRLAILPPDKRREVVKEQTEQKLKISKEIEEIRGHLRLNKLLLAAKSGVVPTEFTERKISETKYGVKNIEELSITDRDSLTPLKAAVRPQLFETPLQGKTWEPQAPSSPEEMRRLVSDMIQQTSTYVNDVTLLLSDQRRNVSSYVQ